MFPFTFPFQVPLLSSSSPVLETPQNILPGHRCQENIFNRRVTNNPSTALCEDLSRLTILDQFVRIDHHHLPANLRRIEPTLLRTPWAAPSNYRQAFHRYLAERKLDFRPHAPANGFNLNSHHFLPAETQPHYSYGEQRTQLEAIFRGIFHDVEGHWMNINPYNSTQINRESSVGDVFRQSQNHHSVELQCTEIAYLYAQQLLELGYPVELIWGRSGENFNHIVVKTTLFDEQHHRVGVIFDPLVNRESPQYFFEHEQRPETYRNYISLSPRELYSIYLMNRAEEENNLHHPSTAMSILSFAQAFDPQNPYLKYNYARYFLEDFHQHHPSANIHLTSSQREQFQQLITDLNWVIQVLPHFSSARDLLRDLQHLNVAS